MNFYESGEFKFRGKWINGKKEGVFLGLALSIAEL